MTEKSCNSIEKDILAAEKSQIQSQDFIIPPKFENEMHLLT